MPITLRVNSFWSACKQELMLSVPSLTVLAPGHVLNCPLFSFVDSIQPSLWCKLICCFTRPEFSTVVCFHLSSGKQIWPFKILSKYSSMFICSIILTVSHRLLSCNRYNSYSGKPYGFTHCFHLLTG